MCTKVAAKRRSSSPSYQQPSPSADGVKTSDCLSNRKAGGWLLLLPAGQRTSIYHVTMEYYKGSTRWTTWMLLIASTVTIIDTGLADNRVSACFNQMKKTLQMSCSEGHMVKVNRMLEGFSEQGSCHYTEGDCTYEVKHTIIPCIGRQQCAINLPSGNTGAIMHTCGTHSTYIQVEYTCVPVDSSTDICDRRQLTAQSGYIMTPRYPTNYPDNRNCTLTINLPDKRQKLALYAIDLMLEANSGNAGCDDLLYMYDGFRSYTTCGPDARKQLMVTMGNRLQLTFESNSQNRQKGFWLYYEAFPYLNKSNIINNNTTETAAASGHTKTPTVTMTTTVARDLSTTTQQHQRYDNNEDRFPIGILAGVLVAVFVCLILLLVIVLYMRRKHQSMSDNAAAMSSNDVKQTTDWPMNNMEYQQEVNTNNHNICTTNNIYSVNDQVNRKQDKLPTKQAFIDTCLETGEEKLMC
ncbi:hypothetical protein LSH36_92g06017 [Paralvinella palmiformis]|uniref:CUB domain-containing protein n=1 Tax=Paralvinella palmiformis TaxID=53620 RepID=A0AAD9K1N9_9ANNE|nr:hypothetical protein LSH36_92g06017 [Paralvinella palmiformis]